jgi:hypothetical protein
MRAQERPPGPSRRPAPVIRARSKGTRSGFRAAVPRNRRLVPTDAHGPG